MAKLYTFLAVGLALTEFANWVNLTFLHTDSLDPQNLFANYQSYDEEVKDAIQVLSCWVGMTKTYMGVLYVATALSSEPFIRCCAAMGCVFNCYVVTFSGMHPAAAKMTNVLNMDMANFMLMAKGGVLGPLWAAAAFLEYREMKSTTHKKVAKVA